MPNSSELMSKRDLLPDTRVWIVVKTRGAFTTVEMMLAIGILVIMASMLVPATQSTVAFARNAKCLANLRQIGLAANFCAQDKDNTYPYIEANPKDPVYSAEKNAKSILETLAPYGITAATLKCPEDLAGPNSFATYDSSYQWLNYADGQKTWHIKVVTPLGEIAHPPSAVRLAVDWLNVHFSERRSGPNETAGRRNAAYADGHVGVSGG